MSADTISRPRARELGITIGPHTPGTHNAITDVPGVKVGHVTLIEGEGKLEIGVGPVRTGVTAIVPPGKDWYGQPLEAGHFVFNGAGTTAGLSLIEEFGRLETPILLTNSLSVGTVYEGVVRYMVERIFAPQGAVPWFNPVVGETSDAFLNDIGGLHVRPEHGVEAIDKARGGPVAEGCVGAGTGTAALGYKAGIGTASRLVKMAGETASVGVLVQANFGGRLRIDGIDFASQTTIDATEQGASIMIVVATDLPLSSRLLNRLSKRATLGMARIGSNGGHGSGDYIIAFSTSYRQPGAMPAWREALAADEGWVDLAFETVADATEEAILNSLLQAETMVGRDGHVREAIDCEQVGQLFQSN